MDICNCIPVAQSWHNYSVPAVGAKRNLALMFSQAIFGRNSAIAMFCCHGEYSVCAKLRSPLVLVAPPSDLSLGSIDT